MVTHQVLNYLPNNLTSVLDVGCGVGTMGLLIKANYLYLDSDKSNMVSDLKLIGIENYKPYIDYCNNAK